MRQIPWCNPCASIGYGMLEDVVFFFLFAMFWLVFCRKKDPQYCFLLEFGWFSGWFHIFNSFFGTNFWEICLVLWNPKHSIGVRSFRVRWNTPFLAPKSGFPVCLWTLLVFRSILKTKMVQKTHKRSQTQSLFSQLEPIFIDFPTNDRMNIGASLPLAAWQTDTKCYDMQCVEMAWNGWVWHDMFHLVWYDVMWHELW